ncbi:MAG: SufE family protein [Verrucomicrobiales bacterium]
MSRMEIEARLDTLVEDMLLLPDPQERLGALANWGKKATELPEALGTETNRVHGCVSRVHLAVDGDITSLHFRVLADSVMVRGLVGVTVRLADGCSARELAAINLDWPARLKLERQITPTRLNGLASVVTRIQTLAKEALDSHVD